MQIRFLKLLIIKRKFRDKNREWLFIFDVDGVLTDGKFTYTENGKYSKAFGSHDADALKLLSKFSQIQFITADKKGFDLTTRRIQDMGFSLSLVEPSDRVELIQKLQVENNVVFVADSFTDCRALIAANLSFSPTNAHVLARKVSSYVLESNGGSGAVAEVCLLYLLANKQNIF